MKMTDDRKEYLKQYKESNLKRVPLDMRIESYIEMISYVAKSGKSNINGFIKDAIRLKCELMDLGMLEDVERDIRVKKGLSAISSEKGDGK